LEISSLTDPHLLVPRLKASTKIGAIKELVDRLHERGIISDSLQFLQAVLERENLQSTLLDSDIALPHARSRGACELGLALGIARRPIDFPSGDERCPVRLICLIAVPAHAPDLYLSLLGVLARRLGDQELKSALLNAASPAEMYQLLIDPNQMTHVPAP
jgi:PTS system fructose-specific IIC component